jgi:hypothetical protein
MKIKSGILFVALCCCMVQTLHAQRSMLNKIELERNNDSILISFVFDNPPSEYPAFLMLEKTALHLDFYNSVLGKETRFRQMVPPPLTGFAMAGKILNDGTSVIQVDIATEQTFPFTTRRDNDRIVVSMDISKGFKKTAQLFKGTEQDGSNTIKNLFVRASKEQVEIVISLSKAIEQFPVYMLTDPDKLVLDLPQVMVANALSEDISVSPIKKMHFIKSADFSSLVFDLEKKVEYKTLQLGNEIHIMLAWNEKTIAQRRFWSYVSVTAVTSAILVGGGALILLNSSADKEKQPAVTPGDDGWNDPPPKPE